MPQRADRKTVDKSEPPRFVIGDRVRANPQAPRDYRRREGTITEIGPGASEFRVEFDDARQPTTGYLMAPWLEKV
jgi:hypothetical protein